MVGDELRVVAARTPARCRVRALSMRGVPLTGVTPALGLAPAIEASSRADCSAFRITADVTASMHERSSCCVGAISSRKPGSNMSVRSLASRAASSARSCSAHSSTLRRASSSLRSARARAASMRLNSSSALDSSPSAISSALLRPNTLRDDA